MRRLLMLVCVSAVLLPAASACAVTGLDHSFGVKGVVDLSYEPSPGVFSGVSEVSVAPDGGIYVLGATTPCVGCTAVEHLIRLRPNGARDLTYAGDGTAELPAMPYPYPEYRLLVDGHGRQVVAYVTERELVIMRLLAGGSFDDSFGSRGFVRLACACQKAGVELRMSPPGRLQVAVVSIQQPGPEPPGLAYRTVVETRSLLENGRLDVGFGVGGISVYRVENSLPPPVTVPLRGGGLAIAGANWSGPAQIYVGRIGRKGRLDARFMDKARRALSARLREKGVALLRANGLVVRREGKLDVFGQVGFDGFVARLRRSGAIDRSFGSAGVKPLPWAVRGTLAGPGGRTFAFGADEGASLAVAWLGRGGRVLRSFGGGRGFEVAGASADGVSAVMQRGSRPLVFAPGYAGCRGYCPSKPRLYRFTRWAR